MLLRRLVRPLVGLLIALLVCGALLPRQAAAAPAGTKLITVNLTTQWISARENGRIVFTAPMSSGKPGFETRPGMFHVYYKVKLQTMRGCMQGQCWVVPNVPNAMFFDEGRALHGTYWHNKFGTGFRLSHGCVNLSLPAAAWLYAWTPLGTPVWVHY